MSSILNAFPFPWSRPEAQELHITLCRLHPTSQSARFVAERAGIDFLMIYADQPPSYLWKDILDAGARAGLTRRIVLASLDIVSPTSPMRPYLQAVISDEQRLSHGEPRGLDGAPRFIEKDDHVSEPEALLFHDDLTLPAGRLPLLIGTLDRLKALAPAVCKLTVNVSGDGMFGTGFRITSELILTNWHVLHSFSTLRSASSVVAEFGYEDDGLGGILVPTVVECDPASIVTCREDDWAVIRMLSSSVETWPLVRLSEASSPRPNTAAYIIQHPCGGPKRVGFVRNQVSSFDERVVHYLTDTQGGSSGSPVFDEEGKLIALHHAGGRPQEVLGRAPVLKNEGIRISRVIRGLEERHIEFP